MSTIMVVDDTAIFREPIAAQLRHKGYKTICAADGNKALDILCERQPDLILLDVAMPVLDGIGFLQVLRKNPETKHIPVILLTAVAEKDYVVRAKEIGAQDYMLKSQFSLDELVARVQKHLSEAAVSPDRPSSEPSPPAPPAAASPFAGSPPPSAASAPTSSAPVASAQAPAAAPAAASADQPAPTGPVAKPPAPPPTPRPLRSGSGPATRTGATPPPAPPPRKRIPIENIAQVKALPVAVGEVMALTGSRGSSAEDLCKALAEDLALAGKVLAVANSSMYRGTGRRVTTLEQAVKTIGFDSIRQIAMSIGVMDTLGREGHTVVDANVLWRHSFACACIARQLAEDTEGVEPTQIYVAALLHDMGKLILDEFLPEQLGFAVQHALAPEAAGPSWERDALGTDHATIAADVLRHWGIPHELVIPVRNHHRANLAGDATDRRLTEVLQVADGLALALGWPSGCLDYFPSLGNRFVNDLPVLKRLDEDALRSTVADQVREAALLMGMYAHLSVGEKPVDEIHHHGGQINYITDDADELDMIGRWLRHAQDIEPVRHELADATPGSADLLVLSSGVPGLSKVRHVARLVEGGSGVAVVSSRWRKFLSDVRFDGWRVLETPVCAQALEAALPVAAAG